jgi:hypothetical protein
MPKQPRVTMVADAMKRHSRCVVTAAAEHRVFQTELYKHIEKTISAYPDGFLYIRGEFEGTSVLGDAYIQEVAKCYQQAGWNITFSNTDGSNTRVHTTKIKFTLSPKKSRVAKKR